MPGRARGCAHPSYRAAWLQPPAAQWTAERVGKKRERPAKCRRRVENVKKTGMGTLFASGAAARRAGPQQPGERAARRGEGEGGTASPPASGAAAHTPAKRELHNTASCPRGARRVQPAPPSKGVPSRSCRQPAGVCERASGRGRLHSASPQPGSLPLRLLRSPQLVHRAVRVALRSGERPATVSRGCVRTRSRRRVAAPACSRSRAPSRARSPTARTSCSGR